MEDMKNLPDDPESEDIAHAIDSAGSNWVIARALIYINHNLARIASALELRNIHDGIIEN